MRHARAIRLSLLSLMFVAGPVLAVDTVLYNNDFPDGRIATTSHPADVGGLETESADDFLLSKPSSITSGSFTGLIPKNANIQSVTVEIYGVFPSGGSFNHGNVITRANSPSDNAITTRDSGVGGGLTYSVDLLSNGVGVANSVITKINAQPNQFTGGEGGVSGKEVRIDFNLTNPITLGADHFFFVPQVATDQGTFLWLSAGRPIHDFGSTPFAPDLQTWIRSDPGIAPDWSRIGTDIIGSGSDPATYNGAFRLVGTVVPEPTGIVMMIAGLIAVGAWSQRKRT